MKDRSPFKDLLPNPSATWKIGELDAAAKEFGGLDGDIVFDAYNITLDAAYFKDAECCLVEIGDRKLAYEYITNAHDTLNKHWKDMMWPEDAFRLFQDLVICAMRMGLAFPPEPKDEDEETQGWLNWEIVRDWVATKAMWLLRPARGVPVAGSTARWPPFVGTVLSVPRHNLRAAMVHTMSLISLATGDYPIHQVLDEELAPLEALRSCLLTGQVLLPVKGEPGACECSFAGPQIVAHDVSGIALGLVSSGKPWIPM